jgi:hypothetical protein
LATAGAIGGTPGSPTPLGFSFERTIVTSTSGISLMRSER